MQPLHTALLGGRLVPSPPRRSPCPILHDSFSQRRKFGADVVKMVHRVQRCSSAGRWYSRNKCPAQFSPFASKSAPFRVPGVKKHSSVDAIHPSQIDHGPTSPCSLVPFLHACQFLNYAVRNSVCHSFTCCLEPSTHSHSLRTHILRASLAI